MLGARRQPYHHVEEEAYVVYIYKINTTYNGVDPVAFSARFDEDRNASLGWRQYLDELEVDDEVWLYFIGSVAAGVYGRAFVRAVDRAERRVQLHFIEFDHAQPLMLGQEARQVIHLVSASRRQVFLYEPVDGVECKAWAPGAPTCASRNCDGCPFWSRLPRVTRSGRPERLGPTVKQLACGLWAVPPRSYRARSETPLSAEERAATVLLRSFKSGEAGLAYLFAAAAHESLQAGSPTGRWDAVVPIPLSPEKAAAGEFDRARAIAVELSLLVRAPVRDVLALDRPVGKRATLSSGGTVATFERNYDDALRVVAALSPATKRVLLVDDVCTSGTTLDVAARRLAGLTSARIDAAVGVLMDVRATGGGPAAQKPRAALEVVEIANEWCLRWTATGKAVAWCTTDSEEWRDYCDRAFAAVRSNSDG